MFYDKLNIKDLTKNKILTEVGKSRVFFDILNFERFCCFGLVSSFVKKFPLEENEERHNILVRELNRSKLMGHETNGVWKDIETGQIFHEKSILIGFNNYDKGFQTTMRILKRFSQEAVIFGEKIEDEEKDAFWIIYNNNPFDFEEYTINELDLLQNKEIGSAEKFAVEKTLYTIYEDMAFSLSENIRRI